MGTIEVDYVVDILM